MQDGQVKRRFLLKQFTLIALMSLRWSAGARGESCRISNDYLSDDPPLRLRHAIFLSQWFKLGSSQFLDDFASSVVGVILLEQVVIGKFPRRVNGLARRRSL